MLVEGVVGLVVPTLVSRVPVEPVVMKVVGLVDLEWMATVESVVVSPTVGGDGCKSWFDSGVVD